MSQCALFLYQRLAPKWGDISSEQILPRLPKNCQTIEIPNLFFKGYWPFWTSKTSINFGDSLLESLLERGLNPEEALHVYLRATPGLMGDVAAVAEESLRRIKNRVERGGHDIPAKDVQARFAHRFADVAKILPYCDEAKFFDNDNGFALVAEYRNGQLLQVGNKCPAWLHQMMQEIQ